MCNWSKQENQDLNPWLHGSKTLFTYNFYRKFSFSFHFLELLSGPWALSVDMMHMSDHISLPSPSLQADSLPAEPPGKSIFLSR